MVEKVLLMKIHRKYQKQKTLAQPFALKNYLQGMISLNLFSKTKEMKQLSFSMISQKIVKKVMVYLLSGQNT